MVHRRSGVVNLLGQECSFSADSLILHSALNLVNAIMTDLSEIPVAMGVTGSAHLRGCYTNGAWLGWIFPGIVSSVLVDDIRLARPLRLDISDHNELDVGSGQGKVPARNTDKRLAALNRMQLGTLTHRKYSYTSRKNIGIRLVWRQ